MCKYNFIEGIGKEMKKKIFAAVIAASMVLGLVACGGKNTATSSSKETTATSEKSASENGDKTYKIGVLQLVQHTALDQANKGFVVALDESGIKYQIDQQNAGGDQSACQTIATKFVNDKDDLLLGIATPAVQALAGATEDIPIVLTAVTDPADAKLVASNEKPGGNITGTSDLTPVKEQIELIKKILPSAKRVGILYSSAESNSKLQAKLAMDAAKEQGLEATEYTVSNSNEIQSVVESMVGKVDVIYTPTDNMIAAGMATIAMVATEHKIPIIGAEKGHVDAGALATYGIDYYQLGHMAGEQAVEILKDGKNPKDMPIEYLPLEKCKLSVNQDVAKELGIDVSSIQK